MVPTGKMKGKKMTMYYVGEKSFTSLRAAKAEMKATGKPGEKVKIWANGDFESCGEIKLKGSNKCHIVGARHCNSY